MSRHDLDALLRDQDGVVACFQVLAVGLDHDFIRSRLRRREWVRLHRRVYLNHTGPPTWGQRAWAAVLHCWPAALADESALVCYGLRPEDPSGEPNDSRPIHVAVDGARRVARTKGVRVHPLAHLPDLVHGNLAPPRLRVEDALVRVASRERTDEAAIACLADGCQSRRTTPSRVAGALGRHPRLKRRRS